MPWSFGQSERTINLFNLKEKEPHIPNSKILDFCWKIMACFMVVYCDILTIFQWGSLLNL
jgi:hypothetical protein